MLRIKPWEAWYIWFMFMSSIGYFVGVLGDGVIF